MNKANLTHPNDTIVPYDTEKEFNQAPVTWKYFRGLTKRELFSAMIAEGMCGRGGVISSKEIAETSVRVADALIKQLNMSVEK